MNDDQLDLGASFDSLSPADRARRVSPSPRVAVTDLVPGTGIEGTYLLSAKESRQTRQGKPFYKLKVGDRSGTVDCTVW